MNGRDVSQLAHEEAVAEFLRATEPILVEVKRRSDPPPQPPPPPHTPTHPSPNATDTAPRDAPTSDCQGDPKWPLRHAATASFATSVACQTEPMSGGGGALCACADYADATIAAGGQQQVARGGVGAPPFLLDSPAGSCDDELLACQLFNDCLNPAIDIEVIASLISAFSFLMYMSIAI